MTQHSIEPAATESLHDRNFNDGHLMPPCLVSILVVTWNRREELRRCLQSASMQTYKRTEIVVVDNGSSDGTESVVRFDFPQVRYIASHKNLGCPSGRNLGFANCRGKYVYSLDDDGWLKADAIEKAVQVAEKDSSLAVVMSIIHLMQNNVFRVAKPEGIMQATFIAEFVGCSSLIRRDAFFEAGSFPEDFLRQGEERDLSLRFLEKGYYCVLEPTSVMYHAPSPINRDTTTFQYYALRNAIKTAMRLWPFPYNIAKVFRCFLYSLEYLLKWGKWSWPFMLIYTFFAELSNHNKKRNPVSLKTYRLYRKLSNNKSPYSDSIDNNE